MGNVLRSERISRAVQSPGGSRRSSRCSVRALQRRVSRFRGCHRPQGPSSATRSQLPGVPRIIGEETSAVSGGGRCHVRSRLECPSFGAPKAEPTDCTSINGTRGERGGPSTAGGTVLLRRAVCEVRWRLVNRGRDSHYCEPPAQIRACAIHALGSYLGWVATNLAFGQGCRMRTRGSH